MQIGGFIKQSLMDYPDKIASVVFTQGCNLKCPYCHNKQLIPRGEGTISEQEVFAFIEKNRLMLDGVVITGGEPTLQSGLIPFIRDCKQMGLLVKLDTNGLKPLILEMLIESAFVDYIAMDIKSELTVEAYSRATGVQIPPEMIEKVRQSIGVIIRSGISHEFRTTLTHEHVPRESIHELISSVKGSQRYYLQTYRGEEFTSYSEKELEEIYNKRAISKLTLIR